MGFFQKLKEGLKKTRQNIVSGFDNIFAGHSSINDEFYEDLEETMIMGDMGVRATDEILEELKEKVKAAKIKDPAECKQLLIDTIREKINLGPNAYDYENQRSALLVIGVNGVGKTTSVGKLASSFKNDGKKVILAAADTFRAGAIEQLKVWGQRSSVDVIAQAEGADPAAVIFDACQSAKARKADILIADTAGRLHNKKNLMNELAKIDRVISRELPEAYRETLIVLDATTGQNAINQLKEFNEVAQITGIILTKMDGTAKGGIVVAIQAEFGIPVKYIGVGEKIEDLQKFDSNDFVNALFEVNDDQYEADDQELISDEATNEELVFEAENEIEENEELLSDEATNEELVVEAENEIEENEELLSDKATNEELVAECKDLAKEIDDEDEQTLMEDKATEDIVIEEAIIEDVEEKSSLDSEQEEVSEEPKKKGFFSRLFGKKDK